MKTIQTVRRIYADANAEGIEKISKQAIKQLFCFLLGLLCGSINELETFSPFGVGFVAAVSGKYTVSAGLGVAAGYILTQDNLSALRYIAAIICSVILIKLTDELEKLKKLRLLPSCIAFMSLFLTSMAVLFASEISVRSFLIFLCEAVLGFALSFVFSAAFDAVSAYQRQGGFTARDIIFVGAFLSVVLLSLSGITLFLVSPARIIGVFALVLASYIYKEAGGAGFGVALGLAMSLDNGVGASGVAYAVTGLACGMFSHFNRVVGAAAGLIAFSAASRSVADKDRYCGDSFESFYDGKGNFNVVLSDGMGTGMRAAVDSSLASSMTARLIRSGFSHAAAFRLVNSALMLKSSEESLATLDVLSIDLYTGNARLCKAGAAATLVKKRESVTAVNRASMPLGILEEADFVSTEFKLRRGDTAVMASDGAFEYSLNTAKMILSGASDASVEAVAEKIAEAAKRERGKKPADDVTVIALKLVPNG